MLSTIIKSQLQYLQFGMLGLKPPAGALLPVPVAFGVYLSFCRGTIGKFPRGNLMFLKQIFAREAKLGEKIC